MTREAMRTDEPKLPPRSRRFIRTIPATVRRGNRYPLYFPSNSVW